MAPTIKTPQRVPVKERTSPQARKVLRERCASAVLTLLERGIPLSSISAPRVAGVVDLSVPYVASRVGMGNILEAAIELGVRERHPRMLLYLYLQGHKAVRHITPDDFRAALATLF